MRIQQKDHNRPTLKVDHCFCSQKFTLLDEFFFLSPDNSIVLEIEAASLLISVTNSCRFWGSFVEIEERFQQTCFFSWFMHALRTYLRPRTCTHSLTLKKDSVHHHKNELFHDPLESWGEKTADTNLVFTHVVSGQVFSGSNKREYTIGQFRILKVGLDLAWNGD